MNTRADGLTSNDDVSGYFGHLLEGQLVPGTQTSVAHKGELAFPDSFGASDVEPQIRIAQHERSS